MDVRRINMGIEILQYYKRISKEHKIAFFSTFIISLLIHLYKFTNTLPNHDSLFNYYSAQNGLGSGRWAPSLFCGISSYWDLPWVNGLFCCIFIALTVVVITALFKLNNPVLIGLIGALLSVAPATTETFFFLFTADGYMIAMFLATLAVYFSRIEEQRKSRWLLSCICICLSCGIYQAYVSFALVLALCYFIDSLMQNNHCKQGYFQWIARQIFIYTLSLAAYYIIWKLCLQVTNTAVNDYQGISDVGIISISLLLNGLRNSVEAVLVYFLQWNVFEHGITFYCVLSIVFLLALVAIIIISCLKSEILKRKWAVLLLVISLAAIIPFAGIWNFTSDSVVYRPMMLQSLTLLFVLAAVLYERWAIQTIKNGACILLVLIVFNNALMANISYFYMNLSYERSYADGIEMLMTIHDIQVEYEVHNIAVVGNRLMEVQWPTSDSKAGKVAPSGKIHLLSSPLETNLLFNQVHVVSFLRTTFGMELESVDDASLLEISGLEEVRSMGVWPAKDSVTVVGDTIVIKLSNDNTVE